ncbi:hypothetical protein EFB08_15115 [Rufibacter latericius]|uniref:Uncharacterized protein n=2 Tax=Rufibacter latericius TaxID=2487040 RepID=A0A3M9MLS6_9BACT|nr:hypothetical protein EFB08_15115 [Rufibacter latericius]
MSIKRISGSLLLGAALLLGTTACSTGTSEGQVNVEESDFKDKSPTERNPEGLSDETQDPVNTNATDSTNQAIYDQQEDKLRERNSDVSNQGVGGAAERKKDRDNN